MPTKTIYFSKARTALKYGLQALELKGQDIILVPDFICDSIFQPISQNSLNFLPYELSDDLSPNWSLLDLLITKDVKAILMVHYFGQPQDIQKFSNFCKKHSIFLIEDNAHGHGGSVGGKELGAFGDIGISSPRKFSGKGAVLYLNKEQRHDFVSDLPCEKVESSNITLGSILRWTPKIKHLLKRVIKKRPAYENPRAFREGYYADYYLDNSSISAVKQTDWVKMGELRRKKYGELCEIAIRGGLQPVFKKVHGESNPWCFAAYTSNQKESIKWFEWGWKNDVEVYSWPSLREEQIQNNDLAFQRWKRILCFSTS